MDIEQLALRMRDRALAIEATEKKESESVRKAREQRLENLKKLYFHAGRWAGGSRDKTAKQAFERVRLEA